MTDLKTPEEERAIYAFRHMDQRRQEEILRHMENMADAHPMRKPVRPQMVKGGKS
ncbi:hypothetical protein [Pseudoduganella violaceinigra]|uniref:hypothetical protein n=1 Tax=Pseudoduganella violaceinigra TaxID=246602 RepID=UPI000411D5A6|nr:hypothetical protein [Pseudoduganella violaceinigra]